MAHRIALASSTGEHVDSHFAQATQFVIAQIDGEDISVVETRQREGQCIGCGHDECTIAQLIELLHDCEGIVVAKIGLGAAGSVLASGKRVFEAPGPVSAVLQQIVNKGVLNPNGPQTDEKGEQSL